jgi:hypothetical protein
MFVSAPVDAYFDQSERARLNESTEVISRTLSADLRAALPNSVRTYVSGSRAIIEMLKVEAVSFYVPQGFYEALGEEAQPTREFAPGEPGDEFSLFGRFNFAETFNEAESEYLIVGHLATAGANAYQSDDVVFSGFDLEEVARGEEKVTLPSGVAFDPAHASDAFYRMFWVSTPVTYICNTASNARTLRRYSGYDISPNIATSEASAQLTGSDVEVNVVATNVSSCSLRCVAAGNVCHDTLVFEARIARPIQTGDEEIRILEEFPLDDLS